MKVIFFFKMSKIACRFKKCRKIFRKKFFWGEIMAFELVAGTYVDYDENTCDQQST